MVNGGGLGRVKSLLETSPDLEEVIECFLCFKFFWALSSMSLFFPEFGPGKPSRQWWTVMVRLMVEQIKPQICRCTPLKKPLTQCLSGIHRHICTCQVKILFHFTVKLASSKKSLIRKRHQRPTWNNCIKFKTTWVIVPGSEVYSKANSKITQYSAI